MLRKQARMIFLAPGTLKAESLNILSKKKNQLQHQKLHFFLKKKISFFFKKARASQKHRLFFIELQILVWFQALPISCFFRVWKVNYSKHKSAALGADALPNNLKCFAKENSQFFSFLWDDAMAVNCEPWALEGALDTRAENLGIQKAENTVPDSLLLLTCLHSSKCWSQMNWYTGNGASQANFHRSCTHCHLRL